MRAVFQILLCAAGWGCIVPQVSGQVWSWVNPIQDTDIQVGVGTAADPLNGAVYVAGTFRGALGQYGFNSAGQEDILLARYLADGTFDWAIRIGGVESDVVTDIAVDSTGAVFMTGSYRQTVNFGGNGNPINHTSLGSTDIFVAKFDSMGRGLWARTAGAVPSDLSHGIAVAGNRVYITGQYVLNTAFNGGLTTLNSLGGIDCFVAQYDTAGSFQWAQTMGSSTLDVGRAIAADTSGAYLTGTFFGATMSISGVGATTFTLTNNMSSTDDIFLTHLRRSDGMATWAISAGSVGNDYGRGVEVDSLQVYLVGGFEMSAMFGGMGPAVSSAGVDLFISAFDKASGADAWLVTNGHGPGDDRALGVAVHDSSVWVSGSYTDSIFFGTDTLLPHGFEDLFVVEYSNAGGYRWSGSAASQGTDLGQSIATAPSAVYVTGSYNNFSCDFFPSFPTIQLANLGSTDIFLGKLNLINVPPPVANDDSVSILINSPVMIHVMANDLNPGGATITGTCPPMNGAVSIVGDSVLYTPNPGYTGPDSFCYTICDFINQCSTAMVYVDVVDLPPAVNPSSNPRLLPIGSLVIPMDSALQADGGGLFNLYAYGLANALLKANIPLQWCISAGKSRDAIDFSANAAREYPSPLATAPLDFIGGPLVIDSAYADSARTIIAAYIVGVSPVSVYRLAQDVTADVRHVLTHYPRIAVFNNGGNQSIHIDYLANAGFPPSDYTAIQASLSSFDSLSCYTFASDPDWTSSNLNDTLETRPVRQFLEYGGNFLAQHTAIVTYESLEALQMTAGLRLVPPNEHIYENTDMEFLQVHGPVMNAVGSFPSFSPPFGSVFLPGAYVLMRDPVLARFRASARKIGAAPTGGHCFYLGGQNFGLISNAERNGRRMYLDAVLVPPRRPATCILDFSCDVGVQKLVSPGNYCQGDTVIFEIVARNDGPGPALEVEVRDTLSAALSFIAAGATQGSYSAATGIWSVGDMAYQQQDTLLLFALIQNAGPISNRAIVSASKYSPDFNAANDSSQLTINALTTPDPTINPVSPLCDNGSPVTLSAATPGGSWNGTGVTGNSFDPLTAGAGTYNVSYAITSGQCPAYDTIAVTVNAAPLVDIGPDSTLCTGDSLVLDPGIASGGFIWSNAATTPAVTVFSTANYAVTITDGNNCSASDSALITFTALPLVDLGPDTSACVGDSIALSSAYPAFAYLWSTTATQPGITVNAAGTYMLTVTDNLNCQASDTIDVSFNLPPPVDLGADTSACQGTPITLSSAYPAATYQWSTAATTPGISVSTPGNYTLTVTDSANCSASDTVSVSFLPAPVFNLGPDSVFCQGDSAVLSPGISGMDYDWSTSDTTPTIVVFSTGTYWLVLTDTNGCSAADSVTHTFQPLPAPNLGGPYSICSGDSLSLNAGSGFAQYSWSTSDSSPVITVSLGGMYSVTVLSTDGCRGSDSALVSVLPLPLVNASGNVPDICLNQGPLALTGSPAGGVFTGPGLLGDSLFPAQSGAGLFSIRYTFTDSNNCSNADTFTVQVHALPQVALNGLAPDYCITDPDANLQLSPSGGQLSGPGVGPGVFSPLSAGVGGPFNLSYSYTDSNGCTSSTAAATNVSGLPSPADAGPDQELFGQSTTILSANSPSVGTGSWVLLSGDVTVSNPGDPQATLSDLGQNTTLLAWVITSGACPASSDTVMILRYELVVPTGFSPNGDQVNDFYVVRGIDRFPQRSLKVFNRWGGLVYSSDLYNNDWSGNDNDGRPLSDDTYYVVLDLGEYGNQSLAVVIKR